MLRTARSLFAATGCLAVSLSLFAPMKGWAEPKPATLDRLSFKTDAGAAVAWKEVAGSKATVVVFLSFDCPMSVSYVKPLSDLAKSFADRGVKFVALCPCDDSASQIAKQAKEHEFSFRVFKDDGFAATNTLSATTTPQVFV